MERKKLLEAIKAIRPALGKLSKDESKTEISSVLFVENFIVAYNETICIHYPLETNLQLVVNAGKLTKILEALNDDEVELSLKDNSLKIVGKSSKASIQITEGSILLEISNIVGEDLSEEFEKLPDNFIEGLNLCKKSVLTTDFANPQHYLFSENSTMISGDGPRISLFSLSQTVPKIMLPQPVLAPLLLFEPTHYCITNAWMHFTNVNDSIFSIKTSVGEWPIGKALGFFEKEDYGEKITLPPDISEHVNSISSLANRTIEITIEENQILLSAETPETQIKKSLPMKKRKSSEKISFKISPKLFSEVTEICQEMFFESSNKPIYFIKDNYKHCLGTIIDG